MQIKILVGVLGQLFGVLFNAVDRLASTWIVFPVTTGLASADSLDVTSPRQIASFRRQLSRLWPTLPQQKQTTMNFDLDLKVSFPHVGGVTRCTLADEDATSC